VVIVGFFTALLDPFSSLTILFVPPGSFSGILPPAPVTTPAMASDSSGSSLRSHSSSSCYDDHTARRFKEERDATRHELEIISKEAGIAELEWEYQHKQLLEAIDGESCNPLGFNLILN
jgi:hypothetical protein